MSHFSRTLKTAAAWAVGIVSPSTAVLFDKNNVQAVPLWVALVLLLVFGLVILGVIVLAYVFITAQ